MDVEKSIDYYDLKKNLTKEMFNTYDDLLA